jgi:phosphohistidine phosphatase
MPKQLYLFRHAEAVDKRVHESDKDRELTGQGVTQSVQMGVYLSRGLFTLDGIFCSTATRARQTATLAADAMKFDTQKIVYDDELYDASTRTLFAFITRIDDGYDHVMCVGHNPPISYLAEYFTRENIGDMTTAGIAIIQFNISTWSEASQGNGTLLHYLHPDNPPRN